MFAMAVSWGAGPITSPASPAVYAHARRAGRDTVAAGRGETEPLKVTGPQRTSSQDPLKATGPQRTSSQDIPPKVSRKLSKVRIVLRSYFGSDLVLALVIRLIPSVH